MSSRALRKAQRELEQKRLTEQQEMDESESEDEAGLEESRPKASMFAMLEAEGEDEEEGEAAADETSEMDTPSKSSHTEQALSTRTADTSKRKKKKKTGRGGKGSAATQTERTLNIDAQLDEIDRVLRSMSTTTSKPPTAALAPSMLDPYTEEICKLLAVDSQYLHAANEMRRLFGRVALEDSHEGAEAGQPRRRRGGAPQVGMGRNAPGGGRGLAGLSLRRNIFIQGKEEWPRATTGGLGMEIVKKRADGTVEYRFVHSKAYQDVQMQFDMCVASMDPQRMMQLLQNNPYHISTLLQVSEIFKQQREPATSGDLLERALFSFGRAVHSTFSTTLAQGKARLNFGRPENREFWLASWRYITNLGQRATWRTAYEWAKLLLSLDPEGDPYCVALILDQLAIRARQAQNFLDISTSQRFASRWQDLANIQVSEGLAFSQNKEPRLSRTALAGAISRYPWIVVRLFQELGIDHIPPSIWGRQPRTDAEKLHSELYVTRAKDIWNTPEATSLLMEVASSLPGSVPEPAIRENPITINEARHAYLTDNPALIGLIPPTFTQQISSSSEPLPPPDNFPSYYFSSDRGRRPLGTLNEILQEFNTLHNLFENIFPLVQSRTPTEAGAEAQLVDPETGAYITTEELRRRIAAAGMDVTTVLRHGQRMGELRRRLDELDADLQRGARRAEEIRERENGEAGRDEGEDGRMD